MKSIRIIPSILLLPVAVTACAAGAVRIPDKSPTAAAVGAPEIVLVAKKLDTEVVDESWHPSNIRWPQFNRGLFNWTATVKNDAPQSREICVVFHLIDAHHKDLRGVRGCRVVASGQEGHIALNAYVDLDRLKQARTVQIDPYESHTIYYPRSATN
jgi:hypothetical protein